MNKLKAVIVDDSADSIDILQNDLADYPRIEVVSTATSPLLGIDMIEKRQPDVFFLDMEMDVMGGLELLRTLNERGTLPKGMRIVFYTAYEKYMIDAIRASVFDYLLKPYKRSELDTIMKRLLAKPSPSAKNGQAGSGESLMKLLTSEQRFTLQSLTGLLILHHSQVVCFRYIDHLRCWQVMLTDRESHRLRTTTRSHDIMGANPNFIQVNSQCIINVEYLSSIENKTFRCCFYPPFDDLDICVSRHYFTELRNKLDMV